MKILGLDASTTTIGVSLLEEKNGKIEFKHVEYYKPPKDGDIFERLAAVRKFINQKIDQFTPDEIILEDIILFMKGKSSATTISSLAVLNRTVGLAVYDKIGRSPILLNVMKIRHAIKLGSTIPAKEDIPELVAKILEFEFPYVYNKNKKLRPENGDMADSIAVALAYIKIRQKVEAPKPVKVPKVRKAKGKVKINEIR